MDPISQPITLKIKPGILKNKRNSISSNITAKNTNNYNSSVISIY